MFKGFSRARVARPYNTLFQPISWRKKAIEIANFEIEAGIKKLAPIKR